MRLRVSHACRPGCALCAGASLDAPEELAACLVHAERSGRGRIYLQGQQILLSPRLEAAIVAATQRGLRVALVEDDFSFDHAVALKALRGMRIERLFCTLPSDEPVPLQGAALPGSWKTFFEKLRVLEQSRQVAVGVHVPLTQSGGKALGTILRLQARLSLWELLLSDPGPGQWSAHGFDAARVVDTLDRLWSAAQSLGVHLHLLGFDATQAVEVLPAPTPAACDAALIDMVRNGIPLPSWRAGMRALQEERRVPALPKSVRGLRALGLEMACRGAPFVDLPLCFGGAPQAPGARSGGTDVGFVKVEACLQCPAEDDCPGLSRRIQIDGASEGEALRPLPTWFALPASPRVVVLSSRGGDPLYYMSTLPALAAALRQQGARVDFVSPWQSRWRPDALPELGGGGEGGEWMGTAEVADWLREHGLRDVDLVITSDFPTARTVLAASSLNPASRVVVTDFHMLERMDLALAAWLAPGARAAEGGWWPSPRLILESGFPGYWQLYSNYGVPAEQIAWRPYSLCAGHFPLGQDVQACTRVFSGGNHLRDLETLRQATTLLPDSVHGVDLYAPGEAFAGNHHLRHRGQVHISEFLRALRESRFVILPLQEDPTRAAGITVLAMALLAGRPLVATSTAATRDYLQHEVDALLVPPGDAKALAAAVTRLDTEPGLLGVLAEGARVTGQRMSTESWAQQILSGRSHGPRRTRTGWRNW